MKVPERPDDSPESFRRQQDLLAKQIQAKMDARLDREIQELLDREDRD